MPAYILNKMAKFNSKKYASTNKKSWVGLAPGVNFTNILLAAFTRADPKSAKKLLNLNVFFALLGSTSAKAACRTLVKLT